MISQACPTIDGREGLVAPLLDQIDCQIAYYIEETYASLFGPFGFLEPVLTAALTLYLAFYGYQLITGRGTVSLSGMAPKIFLIGLVLAFATRWGAYQAVFVNLLYGGADQLAALMVEGARGGAVNARADAAIVRLDVALREITRLASSWNDGVINGAAAGTAPAAPSMRDLQSPAQTASTFPLSNGSVNLLWFSAIVLALSTVGILIITKILLGLLLAVGPLLVVMALFSGTRGLFEGWLRALALYALAPVFTMVLAAGALHVVEPLVVQIRDLHALGDPSPQPVFVLAISVFIFALLILQLLRMCTHLTGAWRLPAGNRKSNRETPAAQATARDAGAATNNGRVADMVVAVERSGAAAADGRGRNIAAAAPSAGPAARVSPTLMSRRNSQRYRAFGSHLGLGGRLA